MKIRKSYVSNSSSSSYVCEVCGSVASGWDSTASDLGMVWCTHDHIFCESHLVGDRYSVDSYKAEIKSRLAEGDSSLAEFLETYWPSWEGDMDSVSGDQSIDEVIPELIEEDFYDEITKGGGNADIVNSSCCPICRMENISIHDQRCYMYKVLGKSKTEIDEEITSRFKTYQDFCKFLHTGEA